jgi:hypothetical protein
MTKSAAVLLYMGLNLIDKCGLETDRLRITVISHAMRSRPQFTLSSFRSLLLQSYILRAQPTLYTRPSPPRKSHYKHLALQLSGHSITQPISLSQ